MTSWIETLHRDARFALRGLLRTPGFSLVVVLTMALGIGSNTAIFSVLDQLLLRPVPYPSGDQVVRIYEVRTERASRADVNPGNWLDWQRQSRTLQSLAAWDPAQVTLENQGGAERVEALLVSAEFFPVLGVQPLIGRVVMPDDDRPNAPPVTVLSYGTWQRRFGGDASAIGQLIQLNGASTEIIGVMPAGFRFAIPGTEFWTAFRLDRSQPWHETAGRFMSVVARTRPGITTVQAQTEMAAIAQGLRVHRINEGVSVEIVPIRDELVGDIEGPVLAVYGAVVVLLAIACLNVANLLLARALSRRGDMAIRASMGAGRAALARPLLLEGLLLAASGGALGILVAQATMTVLLTLAPADVLPIAGLKMDRWLLFYAVAASLITGLLTGLTPALMLAGRSVSANLRSQSRTIASTPRFRQALVATQVAMTVVLLCGAGLLVRTVTALSTRDTGFEREGLLTMQVDLPRDRYTEQRRVEFIGDIQERFRQLPGVATASAAYSLPVTGPEVGRTGVSVSGDPVVPRADLQSAVIRIVTPEYFRTLATPIIRGREFVDADQAPDAQLVFVVNQAFVTAFLGSRDPLTTTISVGMQRENPYSPIVGVVGDVSEGTLWDSGKPTVYYNHRQLPSPSMALLLRVRGADLGRAAVEAIHDLDPAVVVANVQQIDTALDDSIARERLIAVVSAAFAVSGLLLAALGLYGLLAFNVTEQTKDIGIRMALGAHVGTVLAGVVGRGFRMVGAGAGLGVLVAMTGLRAVDSLFYGVSTYDPATYAGVIVLLVVVTASAMFLPAFRAARVDPSTALRAE